MGPMPQEKPIFSEGCQKCATLLLRHQKEKVERHWPVNRSLFTQIPTTIQLGLSMNSFGKRAAIVMAFNLIPKRFMLNGFLESAVRLKKPDFLHARERESMPMRNISAKAWENEKLLCARIPCSSLYALNSMVRNPSKLLAGSTN